MKENKRQEIMRGHIDECLANLTIKFTSSKLTAPKKQLLAIMAAFMSVGQIQGVCDPTNTHNVWVANYLDITTQKILRRTIPYIWTVALIGLIIAGVRYF